MTATGFDQRLDAAADHVEACRASLADAIEQRNQVIRDAVEDGWSWAKAARQARVAKGHLHRILADAYGH